MKRTFYVMLVAVMIITACQSKTKIVPVDTAAAKVAISTVLDKANSAWNAKDANTLISLLTDDGLFCGTDPSEFWDKKTLSDLWTQGFADTSFVGNFSIDKREIRVAADGNSAIAVEQSYMKVISQKIPVRLIYHVVKSGDNWMFDFLSWGFIPKNEDIVKLNKALV